MAEKLIIKNMLAIMKEMPSIGKEQDAPGLKYKFRGIDDILNKLNPLLVKHGVVVYPSVQSVEREERQSKKENYTSTLITTLITMQYTFEAEDGSFIVACTVGEAMDTGDKSANKAMSAAFKYALVQAFAIATGEKLDTEYETHEPTSTATATPKAGGSKFTFRKSAPAQETKPTSFFQVYPIMKMKYTEIFGRYDRYILQMLANFKVERVEDLQGAKVQADFLEALEVFLQNAEKATGGKPFSKLSEEERAEIIKVLDKLILLA